MSSGQLLAVFAGKDGLTAAVRSLKGHGYKITEVFSPVRIPELQPLLARKASPVRFFTLLGGVCGGVFFAGMAINAHLSFRLITWGKPIIPPIPFALPFYVGMILLAVTFSVVSWIFLGGLPTPRLPAAYRDRFSDDRFGLTVAADTEGDRDEVTRLAEEAGAEEVVDVA